MTWASRTAGEPRLVAAHGFATSGGDRMPAGLSTDLFWPVAAFLLATAAALAIRALALAAVRRWGSSHRAALAVEDILRVPSIFWCIVFGLGVGLEVPDLPPRTVALLNTLLQIAVIVSVTITVASL